MKKSQIAVRFAAALIVAVLCCLKAAAGPRLESLPTGAFAPAAVRFVACSRDGSVAMGFGDSSLPPHAV